MCFVRLEDMTGSIECIVFANLYAEKALLLQVGTIILIRGRLSLREDKEPSVVCESVEPNPKNVVGEEKTAAKKQRQGIFIRVASKSDPRLQKLEALKAIFCDGACVPVYVFDSESGKYGKGGLISVNKPLVRELETIFGKENVAIRLQTQF